MSKVSYTQMLDNSNDAGFRAWGKSISDNLVAAGITKTADTGQIDWATVTRPGAINTMAGYEIFRFNDTAHGTYPVFFKLIYGTSSSVTSPYCGLYLGTGSDGSGNLSGLVAPVGLISQHAISGSNNPLSTSTAYPCYICWNPTYGSLTALLWVGSPTVSSAHMFFHISRCTDTSGGVAGGIVSAMSVGNSYSTATPPGVVINHLNSTVQANWNRVSTSHHGFMWVPNGFWGTSANPSLPQVYTGHVNAPTLYPNTNFCGGINAEIPMGTTFTATLVGSVQKTYISGGMNIGYQALTSSLGHSTDGACAAYLWE